MTRSLRLHIPADATQPCRLIDGQGRDRLEGIRVETVCVSLSSGSETVATIRLTGLDAEVETNHVDGLDTE